MLNFFGMFFLGIMLVCGSLLVFLTGDGGSYRGVPVPDWAWIPFMAAGGGTIVILLRAWWRGDLKKAEKTPPTEQDIDQAKRDLARMYEREHGRPPELWSDPAEDAASPRPEPAEPPLATPPAPEGSAPSPPSLPSPQGEAPLMQNKN